MLNTKYRRIFYPLILLWAINITVTSCGENDNRASTSVSLEHYLEVKPSKGFIDGAVVTAKGSILSQEFGTDLYSGYLRPGVGFTIGDVITSTGGTIRVSGIPLDSTIPLKYMYDGHQTSLNITPLTTLVAESMILSGTQPTLSNINQVKYNLISLIDPESLLKGDISLLDGDPEKIPTLEGIGHTVYFTIKGTIDTLTALGYTIEKDHITRLWGSIAETYKNSQSSGLDNILMEIITNPDFDSQQTIDALDVLSSIAQSVYQKATDVQGTIISAQQTGDRTALKNASMNMVYTAKTLSGIAPTIRDKTTGKDFQTIYNFVNSVSALISENVDLIRQKVSEDTDNPRDEIAVIGELKSLFTDKIEGCNPDDITESSDLCFSIIENDIDSIVSGIPILPDTEGIIDWNPKDGTVYNTIEPDFDLTFSQSVDNAEIEKYFLISITNIESEKSVTVMYINDEKWIVIRIPSEDTKVLKKVTEDDNYIDIEWNESNTIMTLHVGSYTFEGKTYTLSDDATYRFTFQLIEGATFENGTPMDLQTIGPALFSINVE